jgi:hypothetical protein
MWALCHSPLVTEAEIALREDVRESSVAEGSDSDIPRLFGEDLELDLFSGDSLPSDSAGNGPMTTRSPTDRVPLKLGQRFFFQNGIRIECMLDLPHGLNKRNADWPSIGNSENRMKWMKGKVSYKRR